MREVEIEDVFCAGLPDGVKPDSDVITKLTEAAQLFAWAQYKQRPGPLPVDLRFQSIDWLITGDPDEADAFQPAHGCAACQAGADQARAFLREKPGRMVAIANLRFTEVWAE